MSELRAIPFYVLDKPYVVWSADPEKDNRDFLRSLDHNFYYRTVHRYFFTQDGNLLANDLENSERRKDQSSIARLLWNHGLETLVMLLGGLVQSPHAIQGFFLRCDNQDCRAIAKYLRAGQVPKDHCLNSNQFSLEAFVTGIHRCAGWTDGKVTVDRLLRALKELLDGYDREDHRAEYNSIKHGLRATHGQFAIAFGIEDEPGVMAPQEKMQTLAAAKDGSHFPSVLPISGTSKYEGRRQFSIRQNSIGWSLEKTVCEIQLLSTLIGNTISALSIWAGAAPATVKFERPADADDWWEQYFSMDRMPLRNFTFGPNVELSGKIAPAEKVAAEFYRGQERARKHRDREADGGIGTDTP